MSLLKKAFSFRQPKDTDDEKPFLDHLEDLRVCLTKIIVALLLTTTLCYCFRNTLMDTLRRPIVVVWERSQQEKLPQDITPDLWEQAKIASTHTALLTPDQRDHYFGQFDDDTLSFYTQCALYYRAAQSIPDQDQRTTFIQTLPGLPDNIRATTLTLLELEPNARVGAKNSIVYMQSLRPTETFMLSIKLAFFAGAILAFPLILFFILQFILPGLKDNEKKALWPAMTIGFGLFLLGVAFCYFIVLPETLQFFYSYSGSLGVENEWRIGDYITFATQFTLIFGLAFELPVVVMTFVKLGLLGYSTMSSTRAYAILTIFLVAAVITPTGDALTLMMLALPMAILYEICIWLAFFQRKKELKELGEDGLIPSDQSIDPADPHTDPTDGDGTLEDTDLEDHHDDKDDDDDMPTITPAHGAIATQFPTADPDHSDHDREAPDDANEESEDEGEGEELDDGTYEDIAQPKDIEHQSYNAEEDAFEQFDHNPYALPDHIANPGAAADHPQEDETEPDAPAEDTDTPNDNAEDHKDHKDHRDQSDKDQDDHPPRPPQD